MSEHIRITSSQSEDSYIYRYGFKHYFYGFFLLPMLYLSSNFLREAINQGQTFFAIFTGSMVFLTCALILGFNTKVRCDKDGLTATYLFIFNRKMSWNNVTRLRILVRRVDYCRVYSSRPKCPIEIVLGPVHAFQDDGMLLATIIERAGLSLYTKTKKGEIEYRKGYDNNG